MIKNIKHIVLFSTLLFIILFAVQKSIDLCYKKRVFNKFSQLFKHRIDADIMIFGSSVAYHGFDPTIIKESTGRPAYNMGWDGMFFEQYNAAIQEYLDYGKKARYIIIGCDFGNLDKIRLITKPDFFLAYLSNSHLYETLHEIEPQKVWRARYVPGYKYSLPEPQSAGGFSPIIDLWRASDTTQPFKVSYDEQVFTQFKSTVEQINKQGLKVIIVMPPLYKDGNKLILNEEEIKTKYRSLTGDNVFFMDYTSDTFSEKKEYFYNYSHLNKKGAALFSTAFSNDLLKIINSGAK
jgi:hypothetical protein